MESKQPLGVLILHGFTGSLDTVNALVPVVEALGLPHRMPVLRGHGTHYEDLVGVTYHDWFADAEAALQALLGEVERVVVVGLSMGGVLALNLAIAHGERLAGLVLLAPALRFADPLVHLTPLLKLVAPFWNSPTAFHDRELARLGNRNYPKFPTRTFSSLLDYGNAIERRLGEVKVPTLILQSRKDQIVHPIVPQLLLDKLGSREKRVVWFERSGHEMLQDMEASEVARVIAEHLKAISSPAAAG